MSSSEQSHLAPHQDATLPLTDPASNSIVHPLLEDIFRALQGAGVSWCLLRDDTRSELLPADVDILLSPADMPLARHALEDLGFVQVPSPGYAPHTFFYAYFSDLDAWIKLDIVNELAFGPYFAFKTNLASGCLERRQQQGCVVTLDPDDAFWALLLHCLLDKRRFAPHRTERLQELAETAHTNGPCARLVAERCPPGWTPARLIQEVQHGNWSGLQNAAPAFLITWLRQQPAALSRLAVQAVLRRMRNWPLVNGRRGLTVALLGPDGAGKSSVAAGIGGSFYFPSRLVYMGLFQRKFSPRVPPAVRLVLRLVMAWERYLVGRYHRALGRLVIFDRYTHDAWVSLAQPLSWYRRLYFWLLAHACPAPDMTIVLDVSGEVMYARKGEHSVLQLEDFRKAFLNLRTRIRGLQTVDANQSADVVRAEVTARIWERYAAQWTKQ